MLPIVAIDSTGSVTKVNSQARKVLGETTQYLEGPNLGALIASFFSHRQKAGRACLSFPDGEDDEAKALTVVLSQTFSGRPEGSPIAPAAPTVEDAREKHKLADYIAHELKNPLGAILALSRILRFRGNEIEEDDRAEALQSIEAEAEKSLLIVQGLLRLVEGRTRAENKSDELPLHAILRRVVIDHRRRNPERDVVVSGDSPTYALGDSFGVELAIGNLLNNAEKYSPRDKEIGLEVHQEGNRATIMVLNRGAALPPERYARLWEIYAAGPAPEVAVSGSGIGLSLCKELVESMGGHVWAGPSSAGGSVFAVTLRSPP
jgi:signal transduction histidine kinase